MSTLHTPVHPSHDHSDLLPLLSESASQLRALDRLELRVALWLLLRNARRHGPPVSAAEAYAAAHHAHINRLLRARREQDALRARALSGTGL